MAETRRVRRTQRGRERCDVRRRRVASGGTQVILGDRSSTTLRRATTCSTAPDDHGRSARRPGGRGAASADDDGHLELPPGRISDGSVKTATVLHRPAEVAGDDLVGDVDHASIVVVDQRRRRSRTPSRPVRRRRSIHVIDRPRTRSRRQQSRPSRREDAADPRRSRRCRATAVELDEGVRSVGVTEPCRERVRGVPAGRDECRCGRRRRRRGADGATTVAAAVETGTHRRALLPVARRRIVDASAVVEISAIRTSRWIHPDGDEGGEAAATTRRPLRRTRRADATRPISATAVTANHAHRTKEQRRSEANDRVVVDPPRPPRRAQLLRTRPGGADERHEQRSARRRGGRAGSDAQRRRRRGRRMVAARCHRGLSLTS